MKVFFVEVLGQVKYFDSEVPYNELVAIRSDLQNDSLVSGLRREFETAENGEDVLFNWGVFHFELLGNKARVLSCSFPKELRNHANHKEFGLIGELLR